MVQPNHLKTAIQSMGRNRQLHLANQSVPLYNPHSLNPTALPAAVQFNTVLSIIP